MTATPKPLPKTPKPLPNNAGGLPRRFETAKNRTSNCTSIPAQWPANAPAVAITRRNNGDKRAINHFTNWTQVQITKQFVAQFADAPSIGLILCKTKGKITAEYALRDVNKPLGISTYQLAESLPPELKGQLPSIEELEKELEAMGGGENGE